MINSIKHKIVFSAVVAVFAITSVSYQGVADTVFASDPIVITASRYETSILKEGKDITVITEEEIKRSGRKNLSDLLEGVPGVTVTRKGTDVGVSNVYIRGGKSGNVLVMIDGVRISDPIGIEKICDISGIKTYNIERIEIVKGAMSAMYGAEASGGVINIITKKGAGRRVSVAAEYGSDHTFSESVTVSDSSDRSSFLFSASHALSGGNSVAKRSASVPSNDRDGYLHVGASGKIDTKLYDNMSLSMAMNYTGSKQEIDDGSYQDDPNHTYTSRLFSSRGEFKHSPFPWWTYKGGVSYMSYQRSDTDPADFIDTAESNSSLFDGENLNADLINIINIFDVSTVTVGVDILGEKGSSSSAYSYAPSIFEEKGVVTKSFFVHDRLSFFKSVFFNAGGRIDSHEVFGNHFTWDASMSVLVPFTGTKLRVSAGTGFRAPTLYELYDQSNGNENLKPETSTVYDTGFYQELFGGVVSVDCSLFIQRYRDMINWVMTDPVYYTGEYRNIDGEIAYKGVEVAALFKPFEQFSVRYGYTYLRFDTGDTGERVYKRPAHKHSASVTVVPLNGLVVTTAYFYVGKRYDTTYYTEEKLDGYHKFDVNARYSLNDAAAVMLRGENLSDTDYEETYGYRTRGRSVYGGVEITL